MRGRHGQVCPGNGAVGRSSCSEAQLSSAAPCTDLGDHDGVNPHLLEAPGVVEHVGPAQGQGEHHGSHVELLATEVQHHRAQEEQRVDKAGRQEWCECRGLSWPQGLGTEQPRGGQSRTRDGLGEAKLP